jgi:hypothetical protein
VEEALDDESDSDDGSGDNAWLGDDAKVKHDMVVKVGTGKKQSGFLNEPVDILVEAVEDIEEDVPDKEEVPIKCVSTVMNDQINCGIQFVYFHLLS